MAFSILSCSAVFSSLSNAATERLEFQQFSQVEIRNSAQGLCLDPQGTSGAKRSDVQLWTCDNTLDQKWYIEPLGTWESIKLGGSFRIKNAASDLCLDVRGENGSKGENVGIWNCEFNTDQYWRIDGNLLINTSKGYVLDPKGKSGSHGADVVIWDWEKFSDDQYWYTVK
ncbi:ricin-type beta-trefoil lectin domain protein [Pseudoalteromonas sp. MMG012]|nr:ricin-type beta-trefoil lectin domain protein [Pseudoalteromonas sp. MMG012]